MTDFLSRFEGKIGSIQSNGKFKLKHQLSLRNNLQPKEAIKGVVVQSILGKPRIRRYRFGSKNALGLESDIMSSFQHQKNSSVDYQSPRSYAISPRTQSTTNRQLSLAQRKYPTPSRLRDLTPSKPIQHAPQTLSICVTPPRRQSCDRAGRTNSIGIQFTPAKHSPKLTRVDSIRNKFENRRRLLIPLRSPKSNDEPSRNNSFDSGSNLTMDVPFQIKALETHNLTQQKSFDAKDEKWLQNLYNRKGN